MVRLRVFDDDPAVLSANPWEDELWGREWGEESDEEEEQEVQEELRVEKQEEKAIDPMPPPKRIPSIPVMPKNQKGLGLIFAKVDHQVALLEKQLDNVRVELLQTRNIVNAVKNSVSKLNKPQASELLEQDAFANYLRIGDSLKAVANDIGMILPDHGRQLVPAPMAYTGPFSALDEGYSGPESIAEDSTVYEYTSRNHNEEATFSEPSIPESSVIWSSDHDYDTDDLPTPPPIVIGRRYYEERIHSPSPRRTHARKKAPTERHRRRLHYAPAVESGSSSTSDSIVYHNLSDSSDPDDWPRTPYRIRKRSLPPRRYPCCHEQQGSERDLQEVLAALSARKRARQRVLSIDHKTYDPGQWGSRATKEGRKPPEASRVVVVEPKATQGPSIEEMLRDEKVFLMEKLIAVQERIQATQTAQKSKFGEGNGNKADGSSIKEKID